MKRAILCFLSVLFFAYGTSGIAEARIGTGFGISIPTGGASSRGRDEAGSYASFTAGKMIQELSVTKKNGRLIISLAVSNDGDEAISTRHENGQEIDFAILDKRGNSLWRWSEGQEFSPTEVTTVIEAHSVKKYEAEIERKAFQKLKKNAVLVVALLKDTPYTISATVPETARDAEGGAVHGAIHIGNGGWYDPW